MDGKRLIEKIRLRNILSFPRMGVVRHVDAGYDEAVEFAEKTGVKIPMMK